MKTYDVKCPICGRINQSLYLEETEGFLECEHCQSTIRVQIDETGDATLSYVIQPLRPVRELKAI